MSRFEVDHKGLAKLLKRKGLAFLLYELVQNAWDEDTKHVNVKVEPVPGRPAVRIVVEDDNPEGFKNLTHAWTLFAESEKKGDATKRGRFNLGEKMVIAACEHAEIITTKGSVIFDGDERREYRKKLEAGSIFVGTVKMTRAEMDELLLSFYMLIPPEGISTTFTGDLLPARKPIAEFNAALPTVIADEDGYLKPSVRLTTIRLYEPAANETAHIYEMGIPVCEISDKWHVEVMQKVPLNADRDNVTPSYLRELRMLVLNQMAGQIKGDDANQAWVQDAMNHKDAHPEAVAAVTKEKFGDKFVISNPKEPESDARAAAAGWAVLPQNAISQVQRGHLAAVDLYTRSDIAFPTPKPFSPDGDPLKTLDESMWTPEIKNIVAYAKMLGFELMKRTIHVVIANDIKWPHGGAYGGGTLYLNLGRLGYSWFNRGPGKGLDVNDLLLHEFAHEYESNHLSEGYYKALSNLGAKLASLYFEEPELIKRYVLVSDK